VPEDRKTDKKINEENDRSIFLMLMIMYTVILRNGKTMY
jgi:hypothetical protein